MGITVHEAMQIGGLQQARLVAGVSGANRVIEHVTVMEVPDIVQWLKGKELILTSGFAVSKIEEEQVNLIRELAAKGCAALVIKARRFLEIIPEAMMAAADRYELPLIELEQQIPYSEIIRPIMAEIINKESDLSQRRVIKRIEETYRNEFLEDILLGHIKSPEVAHRRAQLVGLPPKGNYAVIVVCLHAKSANLQELRRQLTEYLEMAFAVQGKSIIVATESKDLVVLVNLADGEDLRDFAGDLQQRIKQFLVEPFSMGAGAVFQDFTGARRSFLEANEALDFGLRVWGKGSCAFFPDMGVYRLLGSLKEEELENYLPRGLNELVQYDQKNQTELLKTLEVYLKNAGNARKTAEELFVHYKTLQYRLERISEIAGIDLDSGEQRLEFHLGLKILSLSRKRGYHQPDNQ